MAFKVTKSIDFTLLLVRGWIVVKPLAIMQTLKIMIMIDMKSILNTVKSGVDLPKNETILKLTKFGLL